MLAMKSVLTHTEDSVTCFTVLNYSLVVTPEFGQEMYRINVTGSSVKTDIFRTLLTTTSRDVLFVWKRFTWL